MANAGKFLHTTQYTTTPKVRRKYYPNSNWCLSKEFIWALVNKQIGGKICIRSIKQLFQVADSTYFRLGNISGG